MDVKVTEVRGLKSLAAFNVFHTLLLGLKMLPAYIAEDYDSFLKRVQAMPAPDQEKMIQEAVKFVKLDKDEVEALLVFCRDPNGVPFNAQNIDNLSPQQISDCIVAVCMKITEVKVTMISDDEKKNLKTSVSI